MGRWVTTRHASSGARLPGAPLRSPLSSSGDLPCRLLFLVFVEDRRYRVTDVARVSSSLRSTVSSNSSSFWVSAR